MNGRLTVSGITQTYKTDEWYTSMPTVELMFKLMDIQPPATIMFPFDTDASNFVKYGSLQGFNAFYNVRDWLENNYEYDYLITNPPFSIKDQVIEK